jgi:hypothetical protein
MKLASIAVAGICLTMLLHGCTASQSSPSSLPLVDDSASEMMPHAEMDLYHGHEELPGPLDPEYESEGMPPHDDWYDVEEQYDDAETPDDDDVSVCDEM